jgi:hypothetical protein
MTGPPPDYCALLRDGDHVHEYRFIGGPIEHPEQDQTLMAALGHACVSWGRMEQHIDAMIIQINKLSLWMLVVFAACVGCAATRPCHGDPYEGAAASRQR